MDVRKEIEERTAQATHARGGWDIDICRADAIMKQGLWQPQDSIEGIVSFMQDDLDGVSGRIGLNVKTSKDDEAVLPEIPGPEAA